MTGKPKPYEVIMECGHAANATCKGEPICVICTGIHPGAKTIAKTPDLTGRTARCSYGGHADVPSRLNLAFFEYLPGQEFDRYYCGCYGWN